VEKVLSLSFAVKIIDWHFEKGWTKMQFSFNWNRGLIHLEDFEN
jgi:hypothetical protein